MTDQQITIQQLLLKVYGFRQGLSIAVKNIRWMVNGELDILMVQKVQKKIMFWGFPGGAVVENQPANAVDTGSTPGPGRSHMPRSN